MLNCFLVGEKSPEFCYKLGHDPKMLLGSGQSPELLVLVFPFLLVLGKCSWDLVQGSGQSPELLVLVCHFLVVLGEVIPKMGLGFSASPRQSPELPVLVFPFLLVLGQGWKLCRALFSKLSAHQESTGISGAGAELCCGVPAIRLWLFTVSGIENIWSSQILEDKPEWLRVVLGAEFFQLGVLILSPAVPTSTTSCDTGNCEIEPISAT